MNFLAHLLLAGPGDADRLGALMGDFVKGPLPGRLSAELAAGVDLHRKVDAFADRHPAFVRSRRRVSEARRRYASVLIDMFYDHYLARHWDRYCERPLERFASESYALFARHRARLPERLAALIPRMRVQDWLGSYRNVAAIGNALDRMSARIARANPLRGSVAELIRHYDSFEADFLEFIPAALAFAAEHRASRLERFAPGLQLLVVQR